MDEKDLTIQNLRRALNEALIYDTDRNKEIRNFLLKEKENVEQTLNAKDLPDDVKCYNKGMLTEIKYFLKYLNLD